MSLAPPPPSNPKYSQSPALASIPTLEDSPTSGHPEIAEGNGRKFPTYLLLIGAAGAVLATGILIYAFTGGSNANRPDLLIIGPLYKLHTGDPIDEQPAKTVAAFLDQLRAEHDLVVVLEAHSPHAPNGTKRPTRPYGASLWLRWPEFGIHLAKNGDLTHWRGPRDERDWPDALKRGGEWPWTPTDPNTRSQARFADALAYLATAGFTLRDDLVRLGIDARRVAQYTTRLQDQILHDMSARRGLVNPARGIGPRVLDFIHPPRPESLPQWHRTALKLWKAGAFWADRALG